MDFYPSYWIAVICLLPIAMLSNNCSSQETSGNKREDQPKDICPTNTQVDENSVIKHGLGDGRGVKEVPCAVNPDHLGPLIVDLHPRDIDDINPLFPDVRPGGSWFPTDCRPQQRVAVIVPYRDRMEHLKLFLVNIHTFLRRQMLDYTVFLAEQSSDGKHFNRGAMRNIGFLEATKIRKYDCIIFQDVDKFPENTRNRYTCDHEKPRLLIGQTRYTNNRRYKEPPYDTFFGGVVAMTPGHFQQANGYSNQFWGWGSEDDDLYNRLVHHGYEIEKTPPDIGKYAEIWHRYEHVNKRRHELVKEGKVLFQSEGLVNINYTVVSIQNEPLYTNITALLHMEDTYS